MPADAIDWVPEAEGGVHRDTTATPECGTADRGYFSYTEADWSRRLDALPGSNNRHGVPKAPALTFGHPGDRTQGGVVEAPRNSHKRCLCHERETRQQRRRTDDARHGVEEALTCALGEPIAAGVEAALCEHERCSRASGRT